MRLDFVLHCCLIAAVLAGCGVLRHSRESVLFAVAAEQRDPLALLMELEAVLDARDDTTAARERAYALIARWESESTVHACARAVIAGHLWESRRATELDLAKEIEFFARRCREKEPDFHEGAATRILGILYIKTPPRSLAQGDPEMGLQILEDEVESHPQRSPSRLYLADGYIALGDPYAAREHLCACKADEHRLRRGERALLASLLAGAGLGEFECSPGRPRA